MARALQLASRALGTVSPNPAVGAVLVRDGRVVGEGATQPPGEAHAEVVALRAAGPLARGSTLYVTLEPCAHYGRTPPCADALLAEDPTLAGLAAAGVTALHVEGSPSTLDGLASRGLLDRLAVFVMPTFGGGRPAQDPPASPLTCGGSLRAVRYERLGDTLLVTGALAESASTDSPLAADAR